MPERERRVFVPKGGSVRLVLEGGSVLDISHPSLTTPFRLEQKSPDSREAQREQLKAIYHSVLLPHVKARLDQYGYEVLGGGEEVSAEMMAMDTQTKLREWMQNAKLLGVSNREIVEETNDILRQIVVGSSRVGKTNPLVKSIDTEISTLVDEVWGVKKKKGKA